MHMRRLKRLQKAVETRDEKLKAIAENLVNMQQVMVNHGTQLAALYKGRRAEVAPLTTETPSQAKVRLDAPTPPRSFFRLTHFRAEHVVVRLMMVVSSGRGALVHQVLLFPVVAIPFSIDTHVAQNHGIVIWTNGTVEEPGIACQEKSLSNS